MLRIVMSALAVTVLSACAYVPDQLVRIEDVEMAPDGSAIFFSYRPYRRVASLGLYILETDEIFPLDLPNNFEWESPSISPDGKYLAVASYCWEDCPKFTKGHNIAVLDLSKEKANYTFLTKTGQYQSIDYSHFNPIFMPDSRSVLVRKNTFKLGEFHNSDRFLTGRRIVEIDVDSKRQDPWVQIKRKDQDFSYLVIKAALDNDRIVASFNAYDDGPFSELQKNNKSKALRRSEYSAVQIYAEKHYPGSMLYSPFPPQTEYLMGGLDATTDGEIFFVAADESVSQFDWELFKLDGNKVHQLTTNANYIGGFSVSGDGTKIALVGREDIMIYDVVTGALAQTTIRQRIETDYKAELAAEEEASKSAKTQ